MLLKRTMIYLPDVQHDLLRRQAALQKKSMAQLIRECIEEHLEPATPGDDYLALVGIAKGPARGDVSENVDDYLKVFLK